MPSGTIRKLLCSQKGTEPLKIREEYIAWVQLIRAPAGPTRNPGYQLSRDPAWQLPAECIPNREGADGARGGAGAEDQDSVGSAGVCAVVGGAEGIGLLPLIDLFDFVSSTPLFNAVLLNERLNMPRPVFEGVSEGRRRNMRANKSKDTKPEKAIRSLLHALG